MTRALSADFPSELCAKHSVVRAQTKFKDYQAVYAIHGKTKAERSLVLDEQNELIREDNKIVDPPREMILFDPTLLRATKRLVPPDPRHRLMGKLDMTTINQLRHRLHSAFENRHRRVLENHPKSFFKKKGQLESFIDRGAEQVDMLPAWQPQQGRNTPVEQALAVTRPDSEFYFDRYNQPHGELQEFGHVEGMAQSPTIRERALHSRQRGDRLLEHAHRHDGGRGSKLLPFARTFVGPRKFAAEEAQTLIREIATFERNNHLSIELKDLTKKELKGLISAEGEAVPGNEYWDPQECVMKKAECPKETYLQTARRAMVSHDKRPVVQRGKLLPHGPTRAFCIISVYRCMNDVVRMSAYNQADMQTYTLVLTKALLEDEDLKLPPSRSRNVQRWLLWCRPVLDRLELCHGQLHLGPPPCGPNGLPKGFSLTGEDPPPPANVHLTGTLTLPPPPVAGASDDGSEGPWGKGSVLRGKKPLSRRHVTAFFDKH